MQPLPSSPSRTSQWKLSPIMYFLLKPHHKKSLFCSGLVGCGLAALEIQSCPTVTMASNLRSSFLHFPRLGLQSHVTTSSLITPFLKMNSIIKAQNSWNTSICQSYGTCHSKELTQQAASSPRNSLHLRACTKVGSPGPGNREAGNASTSWMLLVRR